MGTIMNEFIEIIEIVEIHEIHETCKHLWVTYKLDPTIYRVEQ